MTQIYSFADNNSLSQGLDKYVARLSAESIKRHGKFTVALSGGSLPMLLAAVLKSNTEVDWSKWIVYFADERCVPLDHEDSNYLLAKKELFDHVPILRSNIHTINNNLVTDPVEAADDYVKQLMGTFAVPNSVPVPVFDLILLGVGPDGHTCSLFPGHELLQEVDTWVAAIFDSPKPPPRRITFTYPVLNHARHVAFVATGKGKEDMLPLLLDQEGPLPAQLIKMVHGGQLVWFIDDAAGAKLKSTVQKGLERL